MGILASPIPIFGTTTRLSILLSLSIFCALQSSKPRAALKRRSIYLLFAACILFFVYCISFFVFGGALWQVISWVFLGLLGFTFSENASSFSEEDNSDALSATIAFGFLYSLYCLILIFSANHGFENIARIRYTFNDAVPTGINRSLASMFVFSSLSVYYIFYSKYFKLISLIAPVSSIVIFSSLVALSGSRQAALMFLTFVSGFYFFALHSRGKVLITTTIVGAVAVAIYTSDSWSKDIDASGAVRTLNRFSAYFYTSSLTDSDSVRLNSTHEAIDASQENFGFGIGPGNFLELRGMAPENAFLEILTDIGLIPSLLVFPLIFGLFWLSIFGTPQETGFSPIRAVVLIIGIVGAQFNELIRDPIFWSLWGWSLNHPLAKLPRSTSYSR